MAPNNRKFKVGAAPNKIETQNIISRKSFQDALIDGEMNPAQFARDFLDVDPYEGQEYLLKTGVDCAEVTFVAGNRTGKTFISGVWLLHRAFYQHLCPYLAPPRRSKHQVYKTFTTSLTIDQASLSFNYARAFATEAPRFRQYVKDVIFSPFPEMTIQTWDESGNETESIISARSLSKGGVYILGHALAGVLVDECAYIKDYENIENNVLRMRLADMGGSIFRISSPNGRNHLYNYYMKGVRKAGKPFDPKYFSYRLTTYDNPFISREFIEEQRSRMIPELFQQNVLAQFVSLSTMFPMEVIQNLYMDSDWKIPEPAKAGHTYVAGVDLGAARDPTEFVVWDITTKPYRVVHYDYIHNKSWPQVRAWVAAKYGMYMPAQTFIDATGVGAPIAQQLIEEDHLSAVPFVISEPSKVDMLVRLQDAAQRQSFQFPLNEMTKKIVEQMSFYKLQDKKIKQDSVMALALCNLAAEHHLRSTQLVTDLSDNVLVVPVRNGGRSVPRDLLLAEEETFDGGLKFNVDPETGIFYPMGDEPAVEPIDWTNWGNFEF